jgi:hypothetical protein
MNPTPKYLQVLARSEPRPARVGSRADQCRCTDAVRHAIALLRAAAGYGCGDDGGCATVDVAGCATGSAAISSASLAAILAWAAALKWMWSH